MIVSREQGLHVRRVEDSEVWILIRIVFAHLQHHTVFQSPGNLGIMGAPAEESEAHE